MGLWGTPQPPQLLRHMAWITARCVYLTVWVCVCESFWPERRASQLCWCRWSACARWECWCVFASWCVAPTGSGGCRAAVCRCCLLHTRCPGPLWSQHWAALWEGGSRSSPGGPLNTHKLMLAHLSIIKGLIQDCCTAPFISLSLSLFAAFQDKSVSTW